MTGLSRNGERQFYILNKVEPRNKHENLVGKHFPRALNNPFKAAAETAAGLSKRCTSFSIHPNMHHYYLFQNNFPQTRRFNIHYFVPAPVLSAIPVIFVTPVIFFHRISTASIRRKVFVKGPPARSHLGPKEPGFGSALAVQCSLSG